MEEAKADELKRRDSSLNPGEFYGMQATSSGDNMTRLIRCGKGMKKAASRHEQRPNGPGGPGKNQSW